MGQRGRPKKITQVPSSSNSLSSDINNTMNNRIISEKNQTQTTTVETPRRSSTVNDFISTAMVQSGIISSVMVENEVGKVTEEGVETQKTSTKGDVVTGNVMDDTGHAKSQLGNTWKDKVRQKSKPGMKLEYKPEVAESEVVEISVEDIGDGISEWQNTLVGIVISGKPTLSQMKQFVKNNWTDIKPVVQYYRKGWFCFRFSSEQDMQEILRGGPWTLGNNSLILKQWTPTISQELDRISVVPVWVLFPALDPYLWTPQILSKMASKLGKPLFADEITTNKDMLSFARVLIEMDVSTDLQYEIKINTPHCGIISQIVVYEKLPQYCHCYLKLGHLEEHCKQRKLVYRVKQAAQTPIATAPIRDVAPEETKTGDNSEINNDMEVASGDSVHPGLPHEQVSHEKEFAVVSSKKARKPGAVVPNSPVSVAINRFEVLTSVAQALNARETKDSSETDATNDIPGDICHSHAGMASILMDSGLGGRIPPDK